MAITSKIYLLTNNINGKKYVGQTWAEKLEDRSGHNGSAYKNSPYIFNAITKYGFENFSYELLEECNSQEEADLKEDFYIDKYQTRNPDIGYNIKNGGSHGKHSDESKLKISKSLNEKEWSPEALKAKAEAGHKWKDKKRGPQSQEQRDQNSQFMKERHKINGHPMQGKHHTEEAKQKISEAGKGRVFSEERNQKIAEKNKMPKEKEDGILQAYAEGVTIKDICKKFETGTTSVYRVLKRNNAYVPREHKAWVGKTHSQETKDKMAEARKAYWNNKQKENY